MAAADVKQALVDYRSEGCSGVNMSVSKAGSTRLDFDARNLHELIRASVHYYNTSEEIDIFLQALRGMLR